MSPAGLTPSKISYITGLARPYLGLGNFCAGHGHLPSKHIAMFADSPLVCHVIEKQLFSRFIRETPCISPSTSNRVPSCAYIRTVKVHTMRIIHGDNADWNRLACTRPYRLQYVDDVQTHMLHKPRNTEMN